MRKEWRQDHEEALVKHASTAEEYDLQKSAWKEEYKRLSEACELRWRDLQARSAAGQIAVLGKGRRYRAILVSQCLWLDLVASVRPPRRARQFFAHEPASAWIVREFSEL